MKQEFKTAFVKQRHIMGNGLAAHMDHGSNLFAQISFHDQADGHHALAELSVFDLPFLLAEFPGRSSVMVGDFETFHAEFRSFPMLFLRSSITGVGTSYTKVNLLMSMYIVPRLFKIFSLKVFI
ncbi:MULTISPECIES: hypothetical protein [unclassified Geobacillus]|uniref:hypothetical protein n=1 Tax=unclassified Geobacillus TaxID=2642459 RepID=UPI001E2D855B